MAEMAKGMGRTMVPYVPPTPRVWIKVVTRRDARALVRWWNAHTVHYHEVRRAGRHYEVWRTK